ncbi:major facilitator super transporter protein [Dissophora globulifera]|uniref:GPI ethanolamine phosphate transferase 2 n=1 Tax=Dissophora globulifera TaxID=979702 RepID=A0A9P6R3Z1_9FUNG|nr:major facilitator super transporter protein [Dissophora globulifera]
MQSLIDENRAIPFTGLASAPTVTLPRLKALTTGTVPGFLDAILNIAESDQSSTLASQDNWIAQLTRSPSQRANAAGSSGSEVNETVQNRQIGFFGDDTWIKLFPGLFFRSEGTSSFFAMDTVEVDNNVTRHVKPELARDDWDALIFHYLGLDHVGHSGGPSSALMRPKQVEMDSIAKDIYKAIVAKDLASTNQDRELPTLFVLCGDHGMNEVGNHGGSSKSEISTSILFMSSLFEQSQTRADIQAAIDPYRKNLGQEDYQYYKSINQVDLVPTLSLLMGLPIPTNNVGKIIPELFLDHTQIEKLRALQINAFQIVGVLGTVWPGFVAENTILLKEFEEMHQDADVSDSVPKGVQHCSEKKSQKERLACLYTFALTSHASFLDTSDGTDATEAQNDSFEHARMFQAAERAYSEFLEESSSMLSTALSKYDMSLLTNGSLLMAFAVAGFLLCALQTNLWDDFKASCLEPRPFHAQQGARRRGQRTRKDRTEINWSLARALSALILVLYLVTLFASSFVEEEHQFWYFFNMTWWAVLALTSARYLSATPAVLSTTSHLNAITAASPAMVASVYCLLQMVLLRLLRSWNQTGQKYAYQIDLRYYLNSSWIGVSWILFWVTVAATAGCMIFLVLTTYTPLGSRPLHQGGQQHSRLPAWRTGLISVLQALLVVLITIASLWIVVYKMDLESIHFGDRVMDRVHLLMRTISAVGYPASTSSAASDSTLISVSGYEMARGCYSALGAIVILSLVLKVLIPREDPVLSSWSTISTSTFPQDEAVKQFELGQMKTLFVPCTLLGTATLLLILLSRRHNAPLFALAGVQLYLYLQWMALVRLREPIGDDEGDDGDASKGEDTTGLIVIEDDEEDDSTTDDAVAKKHTQGHVLSPKAVQTPSRSFRTLPGQGSIHTCTLLLWTLSSFFLFGNSNSIASIDISNAYVGIQAYDIALTGVLTFVSNWAGPIWWSLAAVVVMRWDLEMELGWAKQAAEARREEEEQRSWRGIGGWKREDKGTWNRKTKQKMRLYKRAMDKRKETVEDGADSASPKVEEQDDAVDVNMDVDVDEAVDKDDAPPCILQDAEGFKRHLAWTRMAEHLVVSSLFFGITMYALSIAAIVLRHHLFIWTVFSPKVLYQLAWTVLFQGVVQVLGVGLVVFSLL